MAISVILPAYNAQRFISESVESVLCQTFTDFELLIVDDNSNDSTPDILASFTDPRLRVIRNSANLGVVGALNRGAAEARGAYIARMDADDICIPDRFAKQKAFLDARPETALVSTEVFVLQNGVVSPHDKHEQADSMMLRWMLLLENPLVHPSFMFRSELLRQLGVYLREDLKYAEDLDFAHRVLQFGEIAVIPDRLLIYRLHHTSTSRVHSEERSHKVIMILEAAHARLLGCDAAAHFDLVSRYIRKGEPVRNLDDLYALGAYLERLVDSFAANHELSAAQRAQVERHASGKWWGVLKRSLRVGYLPALVHCRNAFPAARRYPLPLAGISRSILSGLTYQRRGPI